MITKEKQKGRRERDEIRIKKKFYSYTLIIYIRIYMMRALLLVGVNPS